MPTKIYRHDFFEIDGYAVCCEVGACDKKAHFKADDSADKIGFHAFCFKHGQDFARANGLSFRVSRGDICRRE